MQRSSVLTLLVITSLRLRLAMAGYEHSCTYEQYYRRREVVTICGPQLTNFVQENCKNAGIHLGKRGVDAGIMGRSGAQDSLPFYSQKFRTANEANSFLTPSKKSGSLVRGIVCECCLNRCSSLEIRQYCQSDAKRSAKRKATGDSKRTNVDKETWLAEFMNFLRNPTIQELERQKAINIQLGNPGKRTSAEVKEKQNQRSFEEGYAIGKILQILAKGQHNATSSSTENYPKEELEKAWAKLRQDLDIPPQ